jgi:hypothetical protein
MTERELIEWFIALPAYGDYSKAIGQYNHELDYSGPEHSKVLTFFIPSTLYGINCNLAFYQHDALYAIGGDAEDRFNADIKMMATALKIIEKTPDRWYIWGGNGIRRRLAERRLLKYYNAVRWGGKSSFKFKG